MTRLLSGSRGRLVVIVLVVLAVAGQQLYSRATAAPAPVALRTAAVSIGSITQTVAISGSVNPSASYKLSFKLTGVGTSAKLTEILVAVGDKVVQDQPLARIDTSDLKTTLATAQSAVDLAQIRYDTIVAGADPRDVADAKRTYDKVQINYGAAKSNLLANTFSLRNDLGGVQDQLAAISKEFSLVQGKLTPVAQPVATLQTPTPTDPPFGTPEPTTGTAKTDARTAITAMNTAQSTMANASSSGNDNLLTTLGSYNAAYTNIQASIDAFDKALATGGDTVQPNNFFQNSLTSYNDASTKLGVSIDALNSQVTSMLANVAAANAAIQTGGSRYEVNLDGARYELAKAQTLLTNLQQTLTTNKTKLTSSSSSITTIADALSGAYLAGQSTYQRASATPKPSDVLSALSSLNSAKVALQSAQANLDGATLRAPSPGTIATIVSQVGENVTGTVMTMANTTALTLRGTVGEADVAKLKLGQVATIGVDAVGASATDRMTGKVTSIDPVATIQQGVPVYGVDITVDIPVPGVRPGMSGTANVIIASHQDVLTVPNLAVRVQGTRRYVQVLKNGEAVDAVVTFGLSNDTVTEVTSGLTQADVVVLPQPRATGSAAPRPGGGFPGAPPGFGR